MTPRRPHRMSLDRRLTLIPVALLIAVAALQQYHAHARDMTAWKGGGFGMFSTIDMPRHRMIFAYLVTDAGEFPIEVRDLRRDYDRLYWQTRALPQSRHAERFAQELAGKRWQAVPQGPADAEAPPPGAQPADAPPVVQPLQAVPALPATPEEQVLDFHSLRLEVWRLELHSETGRLSRRLLASHEVEAQR